MAQVDWNELAHGAAARARDAGYVAVGLGVLGLQRAQVEGQSLARRAGDADDRLARVGAVVASAVGEWLESTVSFVESSVEPLEDQIPASVRAGAAKLRVRAEEIGAQLRQLTLRGA